jgi:hypothetical protein
MSTQNLDIDPFRGDPGIQRLDSRKTGHGVDYFPWARRAERNMSFRFEQLDDETRKWMLIEFEAEQRIGGYRGRNLSRLGEAAFPELMRAAITQGNEQTLIIALTQETYWSDTEPYERNGMVRLRKINVRQAAERLAVTEFNTWYVRGLTRRATEEGITKCEVYRADDPKWQPAECAMHEGVLLDVKQVYEGHRAKHWPEPGDPTAISVPFGPGCHHSIRLLADSGDAQRN